MCTFVRIEVYNSKKTFGHILSSFDYSPWLQSSFPFLFSLLQSIQKVRWDSWSYGSFKNIYNFRFLHLWKTDVLCPFSWYKPKWISIMNFKFAFNFEFEMIWVFLPLLLSFTWIWKSLELLYFSDNTADLLPLSTVWSVNVFLIESSILEYGLIDKVLSSYGPPAYFSNIFISGKNVVFSEEFLAN